MELFDWSPRKTVDSTNLHKPPRNSSVQKAEELSGIQNIPAIMLSVTRYVHFPAPKPLFGHCDGTGTGVNTFLLAS